MRHLNSVEKYERYIFIKFVHEFNIRQTHVHGKPNLSLMLYYHEKMNAYYSICHETKTGNVLYIRDAQVRFLKTIKYSDLFKDNK